jgi:ribulose kinase
MDVVRAGQMALVMGSSTCHLALSKKPVWDAGVWGPYPDALVPGLWVLEGGQVSTGSVVKWFRDHFAGSFEQQAQTAKKEIYEVLDAEAAKIRPGCDGLTLLDYWQGNRTPLRDPKARGTIWGLTLAHGPAHIFRAIYEGTALGTRHILESMKAGGYKASGIAACGGGTKSALWLQIHADACQVPIYLTAVGEAACLGSAILGAVAAGDYASMEQASKAMVKKTQTIEPNRKLKSTYDFQFGQYVETYRRLKDLMHASADR